MASKKEKKIFFKAEDGLEVVLEKITNTDADKLILNFPKGSEAADDVESFHEISSKAKLKGKEILIESIDDHILEFASLARLPAINPVFRSRERAMFDIVVRPKTKQHVVEKIEETQTDERIKIKEEKKKENTEEPEGEEVDKVKAVLGALKMKKESRSPYESHEKQKVREEKRITLKHILKWVFGAVVLAGLYFAAFYVLPEARITLTLKRADRQFSDTIYISTKASAWTLDQNGYIVLPGQLLSATKNSQIEINAEGSKKVSEKARGKLTVYNGYDAKPQQLVASTRFTSPSGKVFRLEKSVIVPGAKVEGKKITPSSAEAEVVASEAGDSYNIMPSTGWRIPGFQGTPRYDAFYAENKSAMTGGFEGVRPSATESDLSAGEEKLKKVLENALNAQMSILLSEKFKLIDGATSFGITKKELQSDTSRPDKALLYGEADMKKIVFLEDMLAASLMEKYKESTPENAKVDRLNAIYGKPTVNFTEGTMEVAVSGTIAFVSDVNSESIKEGAKNKNESELKNFIFSLPGVEGAKISLWPFWVSRAPNTADKIDVSIK